MGNKKNIIYIIITIAVIILIYIGFRFVSSGSFSIENASSKSATESGEKILAVLHKLEKIDMSGDIFKNPEFLALEDFSVSIRDQLKGRENPFAPIGEDSGLFESTTTDLYSEEAKALLNTQTNAAASGDVSTSTAPTQTSEQDTPPQQAVNTFGDGPDRPGTPPPGDANTAS